MPTVVVSPYSNEWPVAFAQAREELTAAFAPVDTHVEHIGSTAVPGLAAKPVLDVLLGVSELREVEARIAALELLGYDYVQRYEREIPDRRYFVKPSLAGLRLHLHAVERGGDIWRRHLAFRDSLRADVSLREKYQALKRELAAKFPYDKSAYQAAKAPFIQEVPAGNGDCTVSAALGLAPPFGSR